MKLLTFSPKSGSTQRVGALHENRILDLVAAYQTIHKNEPPDWLTSVQKVLMGGEKALALLKGVVADAVTGIREGEKFVHDPDEIIYHPPVPNPGKVLCVAVNYRAHAAEAGAKPLEEPYVFIKLSDALIGSGWPILLSKTSNQCDNEIELAVIIGRNGKYITQSAAYDYIAGYSIFNDVSFRDRRVNKSDPQRINWLHLKSLDAAAPVGPWMVTRDEIPDPHRLKIRAKVSNGDWQEGFTGDMIHKIPELIEYISNGITLKPGDIISTGTPLGVASSGGRFLRDGDVVTAQIEGIGTLVSPVEKEL